MALTSPKMGLNIWNLTTDPYDHAQLADNFSKLDFHDHTPGRGVQIPTEGIADGAVTVTKIASTLDPSQGYQTYKQVARAYGAQAAPGSGTYVLTLGHVATGAGAFSAGNSNALLNTHGLYIDPADYAISGRTTVLRVRASVTNNSVAPATTFTFGLYPISAIAGGSAASPYINTLGTVVSGSTVASASPSASAITTVTGTDFTSPAAGNYALAVNVASSSASNSVVEYSVQLQVRQV